MSETQISASISDALNVLGVMHFRIQCGRVKVRGGWMHFAPEGYPDRWTELGFLETKTDEGKLSEAQKRRHAELVNKGHRVAVVRSAAETVDVINRWRMEARQCG